MRRFILLLMVSLVMLAVSGCGVKLPDTKGMTPDQATQVLKTAGFRVGSVAYDEGATGAVGAVVLQVPAAGTRVKSGSLVALTVAGPPPVTIPDLSGMKRAEAEAVLTVTGLSLGQVTESWDASVTSGLLLSQEPTAGLILPKGSSVTLVFSKGLEPVSVPNATGQSQDAAKEKLVTLGFRVTTKQAANSAKKGTVLGQLPRSGKKVPPGTQVLLTTSTGVPPRPSASEVSSAIKSLMHSENPQASVSSVDSIKIWMGSGGRWWASGWANPPVGADYEGAKVIIYKSGGTWHLSDYGTGI